MDCHWSDCKRTTRMKVKLVLVATGERPYIQRSINQTSVLISENRRCENIGTRFLLMFSEQLPFLDKAHIFRPESDNTFRNRGAD